jgi:hypothetical protein
MDLQKPFMAFQLQVHAGQFFGCQRNRGHRLLGCVSIIGRSGAHHQARFLVSLLIQVRNGDPGDHLLSDALAGPRVVGARLVPTGVKTPPISDAFNVPGPRLLGAAGKSRGLRRGSSLQASLWCPGPACSASGDLPRLLGGWTTEMPFLAVERPGQRLRRVLRSDPGENRPD